MTWQEIKTKFEDEILCPALRGRVWFEYTDYAADVDVESTFSNEDGILRDNCLSVYADGDLLYSFNTKDYTEQFSTMNGRLRHTIQKILAQNYTSYHAAVDASWEIVNEYIPWLSSQKGIMRAEHAVRTMKEFIENPDADPYAGNEFTFVLWYLSKYHQPSDLVLFKYKGAAHVTYADKWFYPFVKLRIEAEQRYQNAERKTAIQEYDAT